MLSKLFVFVFVYLVQHKLFYNDLCVQALISTLLSYTEKESKIQGLGVIFKYFSRQIYLSMTFQESSRYIPVLFKHVLNVQFKPTDTYIIASYQ